MQSDPFFKRDMIKLLFMLTTILGVAIIFVINTPLSTPTLIALIITMLVSPLLKSIERKGYPRTLSIVGLFLAIFGLLGGASFVLTRYLSREWSSFQENVPLLFQKGAERMQEIEGNWKAQYSFLSDLDLTQSIIDWGEKTGTWFITNGPQLMGEIMSWALIVPILSFFMLKDGRKIRKRFFELVPNRFFERAFMITTGVSTAVSCYMRAKIIEAFLVATMTALGLWLIDCPYALVLGIIVGVTNIIPYVGPFFGAAPGMLLCLFEPSYASLLLPVSMVYLVANIIDFAFIFPVVVGNLVQMHPLILIGVVVLGQQYYGLIGMLISIPIAAALKVFIQEIYNVIYDPLKSRPKSSL